ncbi:DUF2199 domain-containing protein [Lewinella sp. LCG006]|uniref:DUF2199 domain-containing protein n=1 Tax=Lewinella sp. LCG006 TaxID=3231911 RepID=UPI003460F3A2
MERYNCKVCGKKHPVFHGMKSPIPSILSELSEQEWKVRVVENDGGYLLDGAYVILDGYIQIFHKNDTSRAIFNWQVWVSFPVSEFMAKIPLVEKEEEVSIKGRLESELIFYDKSVGLRVETLNIASKDFRVIKVIEESEVRADQNQLIDDDRVTEIMSRIHHREIYEPPVSFDVPFYRRLKEELALCNAKYQPGHFIVNISTSKRVLFQLIPREFLEGQNNSKQGYGLHVVFNYDDEASMELLERFKEIAEGSDWLFHEIDGVPTYQIDLHEEEEKLQQIAVELLKKVYLMEESQIEIDSFEV